MNKQNPGGVCPLIVGAFLAFATIANVAHAQPLETNAETVDVSVEAKAPLTALTVTSGSLNCSQGGIVVDKYGKVGFLAPVIGPNVVRGSLDSGSAVSWAVVSLDGLDPNTLTAVTTCLAAR